MFTHRFVSGLRALRRRFCCRGRRGIRARSACGLSLRVQASSGRRQQNPKYECLHKTHISLIPVQGFPAGFAVPVEAPASLGLVKNVVAVNTPETVVPGRTAYLAPWAFAGSAKIRSPTLMMRDSRLNRAKKSRILKYGPSACTSKGIS